MNAPLHNNEVFVKALMLDPVSNVPVVILKESGKLRLLPIWLGSFEANAIAMRLENLPVPRPMTHDLIASMLEKTDAQVQQVLISDLRDATFFAEITLLQAGRKLVIDARPSDAIAVALRTGASIFVAEQVFEKLAETEGQDEGENQRKLHNLVDSLGGEDPDAVEN